MIADSIERIPILRLGRLLLVSIQIELSDTVAVRLLDDVTASVAATGATGVVLEISALRVVDSFVAGVFSRTAAAARILGADTVIAGMQPAVAITLVELGLNLSGVVFARDMEQAAAMLTSSQSNGATGRADDDPD